MPLIVDANCSASTFVPPVKPEFEPVTDIIFKGKGKVYIGGRKLKREYMCNEKLWRMILQLQRAGRAVFFDDDTVDREQQRVERDLNLKSDDPHIIALALVSGARLLCSLDQLLHADFTDPKVINKPRGAVYQNSNAHRKLLMKYCKHG